MTRILLCSLLAFVIVLAGGAGAFAQDPPGAQQVDVVITVRKPDGSALERAPIILLSQANVRFSFTDDEGNASVSLLKLDDEEFFVTGLTMGYGLPVIPPEDRSAAISRYHELRDAYAFQRVYYVPLAGAGPYALAIQAAEAITLTGRLVDPQGLPMEGSIGGEHTVAHDLLWPADNGEFSLSGIVKGASATIWYSGGDTSQQHRLVMPGSSLHADVNLGDITVENAALDATVAITNTNYEQMFLRDKLDLAQDMTLIERSSLKVFTFSVSRDSGKVLQDAIADQPDDQLPLAAGEYFVVPGSLLSIPRRAAYAALLAGRAHDLADAGVPLMTLRPGRNAPVTIDAKAAVAAVMQVGGDLLPSS